MGFGDLLADAGKNTLNGWLETRSYITGYSATQADVVVFKALGSAPDPATHPYAARWYKHIDSYSTEFESLTGDASADVSTFGPEVTPAAETPAAAKDAGDDDDDEIDLFGSDDEEEDAEAEKLKAQRLAEYNAKKALKTKPAAKSIVTLDVKPWDDETNMQELEANVRSIEQDGLVWGASQLLAVGFGIKKLQINLVIEDDKVSLDDLQQQIEGFEDHVQSTDVAAMQKL
ncbi:elongation factor 1-beta [Drechslerella stenobrocha 248]|uniref:Elongation factor 1-beta n=1 Tax=Drechslerella stenobrocha 248 TaxID=1043628 RepID=W7HXJ9_9PEZI|nr:elongation factor 1-beta [Drechslerella stenobrocha 248]